MKSSLMAQASGPTVIASNCPLGSTCRLIQDCHGIMVFDCRYLGRVVVWSQGDGKATVECYFQRLTLVDGRRRRQAATPQPAAAGGTR